MIELNSLNLMFPSGEVQSSVSGAALLTIALMNNDERELNKPLRV